MDEGASSSVLSRVRAALRPVGRFVSNSPIGSFAMDFERVWSERGAVFRALAPAWPVLLINVVAAAAMSLHEQGRAAFLLTIQTQSDDDNHLARMLGYAIFVFSLTSMLAALMACAAYDERRFDQKQVSRRRPPDRIHESARLRTVFAFVAGNLLPWFLIIHLLSSKSVGGPLASWWAIALLIFFAVCAAWAAAWTTDLLVPFTIRSERWIQKRVRKAFDKRNELQEETPFARRGRRSSRPDLAELLAASSPKRAWKANLAQWWSRFSNAVCLLTAKSGYDAFNFVRVTFLTPAAAATIAIYCTFLVATCLVGSAASNAFGGGMRALLLAALCAALFFLRLRENQMRVIGSHEERRLIVNRKLQALYRTGILAICALILGVFWFANWRAPELYQWIGPVAALLAGLLVTMNLLVWIVRVGRGQAILGAAGESDLRARGFLSSVTRLVERLLSLVTAKRLLFWGLFLLAFNVVILPVVEAIGWKEARWLILGIAVIAVLALVWGIVWCIAKVFAIPGRGLKLNSLVLLAPFLLCSLGTDLSPRPIVSLQKHGASQCVGAGSERRPLDDQATAWLNQHENTAGSIPVIIVLAEGGGTRAASHSAAFMQQLAKYAPNARGNYYILSGVSGGALGMSEYLGVNAETACRIAGVDTDGALRSMREADLLTPLVAGLFASDLVNVFVPLQAWPRIERALYPDDERSFLKKPRAIHNRADFFERFLGSSFTSTVGQSAPAGKAGAVAYAGMNAPLTDAVNIGFNQFGAEPIVLFNTFDADTGARAAVSNVVLDPCVGTAARSSALIDVVSCAGFGNDKHYDLPLVTGAHISARFPGSNPPAVFTTRKPSRPADGSVVRFVDGGYFDNSGAAAAKYALQPLIDKAGDLGRLQIVVIHLFEKPVPKEKNLTQALAIHNELDAVWNGVWSARKTSGVLPLEAFRQEIELRNAGKFEAICNGAVRCAADVSAFHIKQANARAGALWIDAPLKNTSASDPGYFLMGWFMSRDSHEKIAGRADASAQVVANFLCANMPTIGCPDKDAAAPLKNPQ